MFTFTTLLKKFREINAYKIVLLNYTLYAIFTNIFSSEGKITYLPHCAMQYQNVLRLEASKLDRQGSISETFDISAPLAFSDGSWWLTGGLNPKDKLPTSNSTFYDKITTKTVPGRNLKVPQAGHCIAEVAKTFISAGGLIKKVIRV